FDIKAKQVQQFSYPKIAGENTEAAETIALAKNSDGLYFKTKQSIWRFHEKNGFSLVHEQKGLIDIILDYKQNTLWGITEQTVFSIDLDRLFYREEDFPFTKKLTAIASTKSNIYLAAENQLYEISDWEKDAKFNLLPFQSDYKIDLSEIKIQVISPYQTGRYFYLGTNKGLFEYDNSNHFFRALRHYEQDYSSLVFHLCNDLFEDSTGDLWIGTSNTAIGKVHKGSNLTEQYDYNPLDTNSYWGNHVNTIFEDSKNRLWIAGEGLNLYHRNSNTFSHFTINHGLASNTIYSILEDKKGNLWLGTDVGLSVFMPETESFYNYYERDGVHSDGFTKAAIKMQNGELLFGSKNGFIVFNPDSLKQNLLIPPVVITKIKVFENEIMVDLSETPELVLAPNKNTITFEFSSLDYNLPSANRYAYKLEGIDNEWVETDSKNRSIRYTNLPPGNYKFLLKGSNNQAVWGNLSTPVSIFIKSPFYLKWWFISISAIAFIALILLFILNRDKELRKEKKTRELEHRLLRSQMNPHFIFNSLGAIQSYIFKNKPIDAGTYLSKFSELVRLILENSRQELIPLNKEVDTLKLYLELQKLRFPKKLNFQFDIDESLYSDHPIIPPMMLQPFIENSIEHGFKNAEHPGMLKIQIQKEGDSILLINEDNGIGIIASEKNKVPTATTYHSLATKITRERIQNMNKGKKQKIELQIIDLSTLNESQSGTRVSIRIPTQAIHFKPKTDD
ncbi:MAG: histidine kinase, partial [Bacteroidales bacterium]|nr:histidine kinase [Bacteroidales bacterium]